jgi:hypothetical protein
MVDAERGEESSVAPRIAQSIRGSPYDHRAVIGSSGARGIAGIRAVDVHFRAWFLRAQLRNIEYGSRLRDPRLGSYAAVQTDFLLTSSSAAAALRRGGR